MPTYDRDSIYCDVSGDDVCCGMMRIADVQASELSRESILERSWNTPTEEAIERMLEQQSATEDDVYEHVLAKMERYSSVHGYWLASDNVNCRGTGGNHLGTFRTGISTFGFTEWLKKKKKARVIEGPVMRNPNHGSYVQMRFIVPEWVPERNAQMFRTFRSYVRARNSGEL